MIGKSLGHYAITAKLGEGGMGEVWRATDSRLKREVAIKVLPEAFTEDADRLARFEREAQLLAQLNHPNIAQIYGLEASGETGALVLELVEGPTLGERLSQGALPVEGALTIARQIAEALEAAHRKGIVHRDLKPQNVKILADGQVKVLDFGLAKAMDPGSASPGSSAQLTQSPTLTFGGTLQGVILGTAAYMAPEQAKGTPVDKRTDIWSFGVVLYEMLTGANLFTGETVSEILAGVLKTEIDLALLPAETPRAIRRLLRRCLERDPKKRLRDIGDAALVIDEVLAGAYRDEETAARGVSDRAAGGRRPAPAWLAATVLAGVVAGLVGYLAGGGAVPTELPMRLSIQLTGDRQLVVGRDSILAFSPDGESLVFAASDDGVQQLFQRRLGGREERAIPGTEGAESVFFSPDGRWIGFVAGGQLMKVSAAGGRPFRLAEARGAGGATWLRDGTLVYAPMYSDGLFRVSADGGTPERLTTPDHASGELGHWWPAPLPGGRRLVFTAFRTPVDRSRVGVLDLETREVRWVVEGGFFGRYLPTGHLVYARGQRLYAVPFDAGSGRVEGSPTAVLDDVRVSQTGGFAMLAVSSRGTLAYVTESLGNPVRELAWLDRSGRVAPVTRQRRRFLSASLSPDGRQVAVTIQGESSDLWLYSLGRGTLSRLTSSEGTEFDPVWSRDGRELFYVVDRPPFELHRIAVGTPDGGRPIWEETAKRDSTEIAVSPDGRVLAFTLIKAQTGRDLFTRPLDGNEPARPLRATKSEEGYPSFSPDGRWLAYQSDDTGRPEIYVEAFPGPGERVQVSAEGGVEPTWARRSGELFFRRGDRMMVVATRFSGERFEFDPPQTLFVFPIVAGANEDTRTYDVTPDGKRLLVVTIPDSSRPRRIEVVTDWTGELARLVPR